MVHSTQPSKAPNFTCQGSKAKAFGPKKTQKSVSGISVVFGVLLLKGAVLFPRELLLQLETQDMRLTSVACLRL